MLLSYFCHIFLKVLCDNGRLIESNKKLMINKNLETVLSRKLPSCQADLDEVCISFYPTLNPELFNSALQGTISAARFNKVPFKKVALDALDEHELALAS